MSRLVASAWYDDGPVSRAHDFPLLESSLGLFKSQKVSDILEQIPNLFEGLPLSVLTVGILVERCEVLENLRLLEALLPWVKQLSCDDRRWVGVAEALGGRESRWELVDVMGWGAIEKGQVDWISFSIYSDLAEREPARMLRVLRGWQESKLRFFLLGLCMERMGRKSRARALFELAYRKKGWAEKQIMAGLLRRGVVPP